MEPISAVPGPALATLTGQRFSRPGWIFERKLDGMRVVATRAGDTVTLRSRAGADANASFPELVDALTAVAAPDFVVDGEVVAFDGDQTSFGRLQARMHVSNPARARRTGVEVFYYVFDLLHLDGHSTRSLPLLQRKELLAELFDWTDPMRFTAHRETEGEKFFEQACVDGWEGLIAKRADAPYPVGRSGDWLKFKCERAQEFVVAGWSEPGGSRIGFGALLLGYYDAAGALHYAGKVGTGFNGATLRSILASLRGLARDTPAFTEKTLPPGRAFRIGIHWVEPELVAQIGFAEWTREGQLRQPRFQGLRNDKSARDVVRED